MVIRIAGPVTADGEIQKDKEGMIIDPLGARRQVFGRTLHKQVIIEEKPDSFRSPLDGIDMECVVYRLWGRQRKLGAECMFP